MHDFMSYRVTSCVPIVWWDAIIFTHYSPPYFTHFFILTATLVLISSGGMIDIQLVFGLSPYVTANRFCLNYKSCLFAMRAYLMENKQLTNNGYHGDQGVRAHTSQTIHSLVTVVFVATRIWLTHSPTHIKGICQLNKWKIVVQRYK